jgi:predicted ArsR family transcriptional regulator
VTSSRPEQALPQEARGGVSRLRLLDQFRRSPEGLGVQELAHRSGLHVNTVRFHLDRLVAEGLVARHLQRRTLRGRPRLLFTAVPGPDRSADRRNYRLLSEMLAGFFADIVPEAGEQAQQIGRTWGRYLSSRPAPYRHSTEEKALPELLRVLDEVGFDPEPAETATGHRIRLRHCPFLEVAEAHQEVVCSLHLGLMQGVLAEQRAPLTTDRLHPFAEPGACVADIHRVAPEEPGTAPSA